MRKYAPFFLTALTVLAVQAGLGAWMWSRFGAPADAAAFGDMFGAVNTLFAGLAFAGVIYAIVLQQQELALQRQELADTRSELARSATAQEESQAALREQVEVAKRQAEAVYRPYVTVRAEPTPVGTATRLVVTNTGQTAAHDLRLRLDRDVFPLTRESENLADKHAFREPIPTFPPGAVLAFTLIDTWFREERSEPVPPEVFEVRATYGYPGREVDETTTVDLRAYSESELPVQDPTGRQLQEINRTLDKAVRATKDVADETKKLTAKVDKLGGTSTSDPTPKAVGSVASELKSIHSTLKSKLR